MNRESLLHSGYASPDPVSSDPKMEGAQDWKPLHFFNFYRLLLAGLFVSTYATDLAPNFFGKQNPQLFFIVSLIYLVFAASAWFMIRLRWLPFNIQVMLHGVVDIFLITLLMHSSGGVTSGLGMLLIVSIAGSSILTEGRTAIFFAALASLHVLVEAAYTGAVLNNSSYTQAGILGASFFATAFLAHVLARRIRASEALARQRGLHVRYLAKLNEQIVQHIQSGIIVTDALNRVRLCNEAAARLLGLEHEEYNGPLHQMSQELASLLNQWRHNPDSNNSLVFRPSAGELDVIATFSRLSQAGTESMLIMLEDATLTTRRAEQLKLTALGRLTASIAHEIRNPLGAISHAAQLLAESPQLVPADARLIRIIVEHCQRVNGIVENVQQLSRQRDAEITYFDLEPWLKEFILELADYYSVDPGRFRLRLTAPKVMVGFDANQLRQVLWNLCENAMRYAQGQPLIEFIAGIGEEFRRPYLDIRDHGPGMSDEIAKQVFEPFFTTEKQGTGLGLYIARGICMINRASLHLLSHAQGCHFRIGFSELPEQEAA